MDSGDGGAAARDALRKRTAVLEAVDDQPYEKPDLVKDLTVSRSTVDRSIKELTDTGLVTRSGQGFETTVLGELMLETYQDYIERTDSLAAARTLVNDLPDASQIDQAVLADCTVRLSRPQVPENAVEPLVTGMQSATHFHGIAPVVKPSYVTLVADQVRRGTETEIIITEAVRDPLSQIMLGTGDLETLLNSDRVTFYVTDEDIPYGLWYMDSEEWPVGLAVHNDDGGLRGIICNDSAQAVEWARDRYESVRAGAKQTELEANR